MSAFTPGPWSYGAKLTGSENHRGFSIGAPSRFGWSLATVQPVDEDGKEGEANARLIAAAPDLLAAAKAYIKHREEIGIGCESVQVKAIRAAIAKAEGKQ